MPVPTPQAHKARKVPIVKSAESIDLQEIVEIDRRIDEFQNAVEELFQKRNAVPLLREGDN